MKINDFNEAITATAVPDVKVNDTANSKQIIDLEGKILTCSDPKKRIELINQLKQLDPNSIVVKHFMKYKMVGEARIPGLDYEEKRFKKGKNAGEIDNITLKLTGQNSANITKIANKYKELQDTIDQMNAEKNKISDELKPMLYDLFNAEDQVYKKYVETKSLIATLFAIIDTPESSEIVESTDYQKIVSQLMEMMDNDLLDKAKKIVAANTTVKTVVTKAKVGEPRMSINLVNESISQAVAEKLKGLSHSFLTLINTWVKGYDKKLAKVKGEIAQLANKANQKVTESDFTSPTDLKIGDKVKVMAHEYEGETGIVTGRSDRNTRFYFVNLTDGGRDAFDIINLQKLNESVDASKIKAMTDKKLESIVSKGDYAYKHDRITLKGDKGAEYRAAKTELAKRKGKLEESANHKIEAYGVRGLENKPWRKTFKNEDALAKWAEDYSADIHGTRSLENATIIDGMVFDKKKVKESSKPSTKAQIAQSDTNVFRKYGIKTQDDVMLAKKFLNDGYSHEEAAKKVLKKRGVKENASCGSMGAGSVAAMPTPLMKKPQKRKKVSETDEYAHEGTTIPFYKAKQDLRALGLSLTHNYNEYRVNFIGGKEATAYYTDDLLDAVGTGKHMAKEGNGHAIKESSYWNSKAKSILSTQSRLNTTKPQANEFVAGWNNDKMTYMLVTVKNKSIVIAGSGSGYEEVGKFFDVKHDQSGRIIGGATVVAKAENPAELPKGSYPLYVFK